MTRLSPRPSPNCARQAGIDCEELDPAQARQSEPLLSELLLRAMRVPDATVDPFHLAQLNVANTRRNWWAVSTCRTPS
jgi:glycerol-3-phosphate dehydrogenase